MGLLVCEAPDVVYLDLPLCDAGDVVEGEHGVHCRRVNRHVD